MGSKPPLAPAQSQVIRDRILYRLLYVQGDMREIFATLFPYFILLYILDSIKYLHNHFVLFVAYGGSAFKLKGSGFHLSDVSPLGISIVSHRIPFMVSRRGLYFLRQEYAPGAVLYEAEDFDFIPYKDMKTVSSDGRDIKIDGKSVFRVPSSMVAGTMSALIQDLRDTQPEKRSGRLETAFEEALNGAKVKELRGFFARQCLSLRYLCSMLFLGLFLIVPGLLYTELYQVIDIRPFFLGIVLLYILIVSKTISAHRKLYGSEKGHRYSTILSLVFYPVCAIHATTHLTRDLFGRFDYVTLAAALLSPSAFLPVIRKELYMIEHLKSQLKDPDWAEAWDLRETHLNSLATWAGITVNQVFACPEKEDQMILSYCPLCSAQYRINHDHCPDCGARLRRF